MPKNSTFGRLLILLAIACCSPHAAFAGTSVIVNAANKTAPDREKIKAVFLGTARRWADGSPAQPLDLPANDAIRNGFYEKLMDKSGMEMKIYWSTTIFTGAGVPPKPLSNAGEVLKFVEENPGAVGYVDSASAGPKVKVVLTLE